MKIRIPLLAIALISVSCAAPGPVARPERVIGAYAWWNMDRVAPAALPWDRLTHVGYAFAYPKEDGSIDLSRAGKLGALVDEAKRHGVKVLLAIGGGQGSEGFRAVALNPALRAKFTQHAMRIIKEQGIDGIDIDWEHWKGGEEDPEGRQALLDLVKGLAVALRPAGKLLTVDVFAGDWYGKHYDAALADHADWLQVMAYDGSGSWSEKPGPHSSFEMVEQAMGYWLAKVGREKAGKLVLNVPFYGKKFLKGFVTGQEVGGMDYAELVKLDPKNADRDHFKSESYSVYYDGRKTLRKKIDAAVKHGLAGVGIWELTQDSADPNLSLIHVFPRR